MHTSCGGGTFITKHNASAYLDCGIAVTGALAVNTNMWHEHETAGIQRDSIICCQTATLVNYKRSRGEQPLNVTINSNNTEKYIQLPKISNQLYTVWEGNRLYLSNWIAFCRESVEMCCVSQLAWLNNRVTRTDTKRDERNERVKTLELFITAQYSWSYVWFSFFVLRKIRVRFEVLRTHYLFHKPNPF